MKKLALAALICLIAPILFSCVSLRDSDAQSRSDSSEPEIIVNPDGYIDPTVSPSEYCSSASRANRLPTPPDPYAGVSISLIAAGDNLIHENITTDAKTRGTESKRYNFLPIYTDIADMIYSADIAFINQETVMAGESYGYSGYPQFNAPQSLGDDLVTLGFDVINIANNHMLDMYTSGLIDTIKFWKNQPVTMIGGYEDAADYENIRITEEDGVRIAWLSYTYGTNGLSKKADSDVVIPYIDDEIIVSDLSRAQEASDFVIVSVHWGDENTQQENDEQRRLAQLIADGGADLILGHHSHTLQPIEWIHTDRKDVLCTYSLGNLISGMARPVNEVGGLLTLDIVTDGKGGLTVENVLFTPTVFWFGSDWYGTHLYLMEDFTNELAASHYVAYKGYDFTVRSVREIVTAVIDEEFLPEYLRAGN